MGGVLMTVCMPIRVFQIAQVNVGQGIVPHDRIEFFKSWSVDMLRNLTIKQRLIMRQSIIAILLLVVGIAGIVGMRNINARLEAMYDHDTVPTAQIAQIDRLLLHNRLAIANAMANPTAAEIQKNTAEIEANLAEIDKTWGEYMAGPMDVDRKMLVEEFAEYRKRLVQEGLRPAIELLRAGKIDAARKHDLDVIRSAFLPARESIEALMKFQIDAAKKRGADAAYEAALMRNIVIAMILFALTFAVVMAMRLIKAITGPLNHAVTVANRIANGELGNDIEVKSHDEIGKLLGALRIMNEKLVKIAMDVRTNSDSVGSAAKQIAGGNADLSQRTQEQASALEQTASSMEEMTSTVKQNADNARQANQLAASAREQAEKGGTVVSRAVSAMSEISDSSKKIADIIGVINEIAFQTNLL
ncbi:MAG: HAMP domain-containing protein, partial [Gammaproteobacteria bacterium]